MLCGTDGGLKDGLGTSEYVITVPDSEVPLVIGHAAELHAGGVVSSTWYELLGQLAVAY